MKTFCDVLWKLVLSFLYYYLVIQIPYLGFSLCIIGFVLLSILKPLWGLIILPTLIFNELLPFSLLFLIIGLSSFLLKNYFLRKRLYLAFYIIFASGLSNAVYGFFSQEFFYHYTTFIYIPLGLLIIYPLDLFNVKDTYYLKINNYPLIFAIMYFFMSLGSLNTIFSFFFISFFVISLSLLHQKDISFSLSCIMTFLNPTLGYYLLPLLSIAFSYPLIGLGVSAFVFLINVITPILSFDLFYELLLSLILNGALFYLIYPQPSRKQNLNFLYQNIIENFNDQILRFASFLDNFSRHFTSSHKIKTRISDSFQAIIQTHCAGCSKNEVCYTTNKNETYNFIKASLIYGNNIHYEKNTSEIKDFTRRCLQSKSLINQAHSLRNRYNLSDTSIKEKALNSQIFGISNTLRQYAVDLSSKKEIPLVLFLNLKEAIHKHGYFLIMYNVRKFFKDDFFVEVGISAAKELDLKQTMRFLANQYLRTNSSIEIKQNINDVVYFNIIPKVNYHIVYGQSSFAKPNMHIGGDNYLIKDDCEGKFIAALSDGMGSGYKAFDESKSTLNMVDRLTDFEINVGTSINMLNTFYSLKDNMDYYATLDLLEINKTTGTALLYKMGSSDTIVFSNSKLQIINNTHLPCGIDDLISEKVLQLYDNDLIILMSDGIRDNLYNLDLEENLAHLHNQHPQQIAYEIINLILEKKENIKDDMSLVVIRVNTL